MRSLIAVGICGLLAPGAFGQPNANPLGGGNAPYAPNYYNRNSQPLSPYLNLLRGGNPAVNYFYGVRPGLMTGAFGSPLSNQNANMGRQTFFPQFETLYDGEDVSPLDGLRPTGHMSGYGSTLNYFGAGTIPVFGGQRGSGQGQGQGMGQQQQRATISPPRGTGDGGIR